MMSIIGIGSLAFASIDEKFVIVELTHQPGDGGWPYLQLDPTYGFNLVNNSVIEVLYLSRAECSKAVEKKISEANEAFEHFSKDNSWGGRANNSIARNTYVADSMGQTANNYFCISADIWNGMDRPDYSGDKNVLKGEEDRGRDMNVFISALKKCGLSDFHYEHINLAETPFICDKYSEKNPVPYKPFDEVIKMKK